MHYATSVVLLDTNGKKVLSQKTANQPIVSLNTENLQAGFYFF